jgi:hypothetical protein
MHEGVDQTLDSSQISGRSDVAGSLTYKRELGTGIRVVIVLNGASTSVH